MRAATLKPRIPINSPNCMVEALVSLGSNQGDRRALLAAAVEALDATEGCRVCKVSRWMATVPIGGPGGQAEFLNGAARLETTLSAENLLQRLHEIEAAQGRERTVRWGPRTLDLDLLLYGNAQIDMANLAVPHGGLEYRRFVLQPAVEVAADMVHPRLGWTLAQLLEHLETSPPWLAVAAEDESRSLAFIEQLAQASPIPLTVCTADEAAAAARAFVANMTGTSGTAGEHTTVGSVRRPTRFWISVLPGELIDRTGHEVAGAPPLPVPRLTFAVDRPPLAWAPGLSLATAELVHAVQQAVAAIEASLPEKVLEDE